MSRQELPNANRECNQRNTTHGRSSGISTCRLTGPNYSAHALLLFAFALVLFNQGHTAGEDRRKRQEEATEAGTEFLGDQARAQRYKASDNKAQQEFPPFGAF